MMQGESDDEVGMKVQSKEEGAQKSPNQAKRYRAADKDNQKVAHPIQ